MHNAVVEVLRQARAIFAQMKIPAGRSKLDKPPNQMTKEELLRRFESAGSAYGAYTIQGNVLSRKHPSNTQVIRELVRSRVSAGPTSFSPCGQCAHTAKTPSPWKTSRNYVRHAQRRAGGPMG